jgi:hypothetical protein
MPTIYPKAPPVKPDKHQLSPAEADRLAELEPIIERGLATFYEVGSALLEISDQRLYRRTHSSFKDYVQDKWKMCVRHAYRLCESAEVIKSLPAECVQLVTSESQVRELAKVPADERVEVLEVVAKDGPVTAKAIKAVLKRSKPSKLNDGPLVMAIDPFVDADAVSRGEIITFALCSDLRVKLRCTKAEVRALFERWIDKSTVQEGGQ